MGHLLCHIFGDDTGYGGLSLLAIGWLRDTKQIIEYHLKRLMLRLPRHMDEPHHQGLEGRARHHRLAPRLAVAPRLEAELPNILAGKTKGWVRHQLWQQAIGHRKLPCCYGLDYPREQLEHLDDRIIKNIVASLVVDGNTCCLKVRYQRHQLAVTPSQDGNLLGRRATVDLLADLLRQPLALG